MAPSFEAADRAEERRRRYLAAMGVTVWERRDAPAPEPPAVPVPKVPEPSAAPEPAPPARAPAAPVAAAGSEAAVETLDLPALARAVSGCTRCALHESRSRTVFGVGDPQARCMVIGEAPGADEDRQGEPFVGRAGRLLNLMLRAIGLAREEVYIANIIKCRPPKNRDPRPEEVGCCTPYLRRQIELVSPRVIVAAGRVAAQNLLGTSAPIGRLRGGTHVYPGAEIPVVVTYHPAYLLRSPGEKRKSWEDLKRVRALLVEGNA